MKEEFHKGVAAWHGKKAKSSDNAYFKNKKAALHEPHWMPSCLAKRDKYLAAAAKAKQSAKDHTDSQQEHLKRQEECKKEREGNPAPSTVSRGHQMGLQETVNKTLALFDRP